MANAEDEAPKISQISHGPNSPNIIGDNNRVVITHPTGFTERQKAAIARRMAVHDRPENFSDMIWCVMGDSESTRVAMDLVESFRLAGWEMPGNGFCQGFGGPIFKG